MITNLEHMKNIGTKLFAMIVCHCPDYPIYVPFDLEGKEWILGWMDEPLLFGMSKGIYIKNKSTNIVRMFDSVPTFLFEIQDEKVDWPLLSERVSIGARAVAALNKRRVTQLDEVLGEDFCKNSLEVQIAIEQDMYKRNEKITSKVMYEWLTKKTAPTEDIKEQVKLTVVENDDE